MQNNNEIKIMMYDGLTNIVKIPGRCEPHLSSKGVGQAGRKTLVGGEPHSSMM
jgi:hypothetical protein